MAVVDADQPQAQDFIHVEQVTDVGPGVMTAREAFATRFDGVEVGLHGPTLDGKSALGGEGRAIAGHSGGQHAIEHVHAAGHQFDELRWSSEAHGVAGLVFW